MTGYCIKFATDLVEIKGQEGQGQTKFDILTNFYRCLQFEIRGHF